MAGLGSNMVSPALSSLLQNVNTQNLMAAAAAKPNIMDRHHYSGPSGYGEPFSSSAHKGKHSVALSALTFLAFIFFLNILQNCLEEHMKVMNPEVIVMQPARVQKVRTNAEDRKADIQEVEENPVKPAPAKKRPVVKPVAQNYFDEKHDEENPFYRTQHDEPYREHIVTEPAFSQNPHDDGFFNNRRYDRIAKNARFGNASVNYGKIQRVDV